MTKLNALLFDVDGTLADTEADGHRVAFNKAFNEAGLDWNWDVDLYGKLLAVTGGKERIKFYVEDFLTDFSPNDAGKLKVKGHLDLQTFAAILHQRKTHFYLEMLKQGEIPLRTGVKRLLSEAREAGLRLGIATTTTPENVTYLLTSTLGEEAVTWFEVIAAGDVVAAKKPAADIFLYAMDKMGINAAETLAFEDSENGLRSSLGASLRTIVTTNSYTTRHDFSGALIVLDQMGEVDKPFTVIEGDAGGHQQLTVAMLQDLHTKHSLS